MDRLDAVMDEIYLPASLELGPDRPGDDVLIEADDVRPVYERGTGIVGALPRCLTVAPE